MTYLFALGAALSNALVSVLQRMGVEDAGEGDTLRLSLLAHALRRGVWLLGLAFMVCAFVLQALALHAGDLTEVQPILVTELLFLVFILSTWFGYRTGPREWLGVGLASAGLAGFLAFSAPTGGTVCPAASDGSSSAVRAWPAWCSRWRWHSEGRAGGGRRCSALRRPSASPSPRR